MPEDISLSLVEAEALVMRALLANRTSEANARSVASALVAAESCGQKGHGLSRVASYAAQAANGKVQGFAVPRWDQIAPGAGRVDAGLGFAFPAIDLALDRLPALARSQGIAVAAIHRSHHFGQAGLTVEKLARQGLIGLLFGNTPKAMALWGGRQPMLGTNPIAFACPLPQQDPLVIDLALSEAARGRIVAADKAGQSIPLGWALDADGNPTTEPARALKGSMLPVGGVKGFALALMVEILAAALTASHFGFEASSVLDDKGAAPALGQTLLAIDADRLSGGDFLARMAVLVAAFEAEPGARLPGIKRLTQRQTAQARGLALSPSLHQEIVALAALQS